MLFCKFSYGMFQAERGEQTIVQDKKSIIQQTERDKNDDTDTILHVVKIIKFHYKSISTKYIWHIHIQILI